MSAEFTEGDIFYIMLENEIHPFKLLFVEHEFNCYHVLCYAPINSLPEDISSLKLQVTMLHTPVDANGFPGAKLWMNQKVQAHELIGYHEYLRQTRGIDYCIELAKDYYKKAYYLTDDNKYDDAIDFYTRAFDLVPHFYQAIDNRAFCKMDLGLWQAAIDDFRQSLKIKPDSVLAEFSMGECYFKMQDYSSAKQHFLKALALDPDHQKSRDFLEKIKSKIG